MWEGVERFLKIVEVTGKVCVDAKTFEHSTAEQLVLIQEELNKRLLKTEYDSLHHSFKTNLNKSIDSRFDALEKMIKSVESNSENDLFKLDKKIDQYEQNTLWKIKDYEDLLTQRPTT